jgi:hypothetical protein
VRLGDGNVCIFQGNKCTRFNLEKDPALDGYPRRIADDWPGMPDRNIDAAVNYDSGSIYFLIARSYTRFDLGQNKVAQPFQSIASQWHRMPDVRVEAAVEWSDSDYKVACVPVYDTSFWNDDRSIRVSNNCYNYGCNRPCTDSVGRGATPDTITPIRGVLMTWTKASASTGWSRSIPTTRVYLAAAT